MAGDWIKMTKDLPDKPEVWSMAGFLGIDADSVVGKLLRVWAWFDSHTQDGNASSVTYPLLDRIAGVSGFAEAMAMCGWLEQSGSVLRIPNFGRHNGETAKKRALTNERVAKSREMQRNSNAECNDASVTPSVTESVTREEKRREEKKEQEQGAAAASPAFSPSAWLQAKGVDESVARDFIALRKSKKAALTLTALEGIEREAAKARMPLGDALRNCCERGWQGFKADWLADKATNVTFIARNGVPHSSAPTKPRQML
ncbi:MAG: hypothetical protein ACK5PG_06035 [Lysobacterales bacterium]|jgi:hypothetical protein